MMLSLCYSICVASGCVRVILVAYLYFVLGIFVFCFLIVDCIFFFFFFFFFQAEDGIRDHCVTGVQTCALQIYSGSAPGYLLGGAYLDSVGGVDGSGCLKLTTSFYNGQMGSFILDDLDGGAPITGFRASFRMLIGGGSGADGLSLNFANDYTWSEFGEEGDGTGLTISFDTYNNGGGEAPAIDVKKGGNIIFSRKGNLELFRTGDYVDVVVQVDP